MTHKIVNVYQLLKFNEYLETVKQNLESALAEFGSGQRLLAIFDQNSRFRRVFGTN
jgi:hypothetical protein